MAIRHVVVAGNRTTFRNKEMCHEEIHRRARADLADRDPVAHRDCKRSPGVPVELLVREQRLLTISWANERFCSRLTTWHSRRKINFADKALLLAAVPGVGPSSMARWDERKSGQGKARQIKSRCAGMIT